MPAESSPHAAAGRRRVPGWSTHPAVGVLVLLALAVALIWRGEPQPSSRPSGTSVGVAGTTSANARTPALLLIRDGRLELLFGSRVIRSLTLPGDATPRSMLTSRGLTVVLGVRDGRQRAYAINSHLVISDLGYADAVLPAAGARAAVIVESAVADPGTLPPGPAPSLSASPSPTGTAGSSTSAPPKQQPLRDFQVRRVARDGRQVGTSERLPSGYRAAADTAVGLTVWQPVNRVFDRGVEQESLSAAALLIRPDGSHRDLGSVHPLAADGTQLLVWDVRVRRFGVMPLQYVTSTATTTASPTATPTGRAPGSRSAEPSSSPTVVAGTRWFLPTRGMLLVTGPAAFDGDGSAFAVYAMVGSRRRLVVAELANLGTDQVEVLVLNQPTAKSSSASSTSSLVQPSPSGSRSASAGLGPPALSRSAAAGTSATRPDGSSARGTASASGQSSDAGASPAPSSTSTLPSVAPDGYPIEAPLAPLWLDDGQVVAVAQDGTVIGYRPGGSQSAALDFGVTGIHAMAPTP